MKEIMVNRAFCWICKIEYDYEDYDAVMNHHDQYFDKHRAFYRCEDDDNDDNDNDDEKEGEKEEK